MTLCTPWHAMPHGVGMHGPQVLAAGIQRAMILQNSFLLEVPGAFWCMVHQHTVCCRACRSAVR